MPLDTKSLMSIADICRKAVDDATAPLIKRIDELETYVMELELKEGPVGPQGAPGPAGEKGDVGPIGERGEQGPAGEKGEPGDIGPQGPPGLDGKDGFNGKDGKDGTDGADGAMGPPGEKGADGANGADGRDGKDGRDGTDGKSAAAPTELQVQEGLRALWPDIRDSMVKHLPKIEHKGVYEAGTQYYAGDEVIWKDSSFRALRNTTEDPSSDDWQCIAKSKAGRRGPVGDVGPEGPSGMDGKDGVSVGDIVMEDGTLVISKTDGEATVIDFETMMSNAVAKFMLKGDEDGTTS